MPIVDIKGVGKVQFPDEWSHDQIVDAIKSQVIPQYKEHEKKTGFVPAVKAGWHEFLGGTEQALGESLGNETLTQSAKENLAKSRSEAERTTAQDIANAQGILPTAGAWLSQNVTEPLGGIVGGYGAPIAAGLAGSLAAPEAIGAATLTGLTGEELATASAARAAANEARKRLVGGVASTVTAQPAEMGRNIEAQKEAHPNEPVNLVNAALASIPEAALVGFGMPGTKYINKLGPQLLPEAEKLLPKVAEGQLTREEAIQSLTGKIPSYLQAMAANTAAGTAMMAGTEEIRRAQAGQDLMSLGELGETAKTAGLLSPIFAAFHPSGRREAVGKIEETGKAFEAQQQADLEKIDAERQRQAEVAQRAKDDAEFAKLLESAAVRERIFTDTGTPLQKIINQVTGVEREPVKVTRKDVNAALNEPSGVRVNDVNGVEKELTVGELQLHQNPELFTEEAKQVLALPKAEQEPLIAFPDGSIGTHQNAKEYIAGLPEEQQVAARAQLIGYRPEVAETKLDKTTLTSLVPDLTPQAGVYKRLIKLENIDSEEKLNKLHTELNKLGDKYAVNEGKLKEIEDAYKTQTEQREASKRNLIGANVEEPGVSLPTIGERPGRGGTAGITGADLGRVVTAGEPVREPAVGTSGLNAPLEAAPIPEAPKAAEVVQPAEAPQSTEVMKPEVDHTVEAKQVAAELKSLDPEHPMIEPLKDELSVTPEEVQAAKQEVQTLRARHEEMMQKAEEELPTVDERAQEPDVDIEKFEAAKSTIHEYVRQKTGVAKNIVPEEQVTTGQALSALADIMTHLVRQGVRTMGEAVRQARKALGENAKHIPKEEYFKAYSNAIVSHETEQLKAKAPKPAPAAVARPDLEATWQATGGTEAPEEKATSLFQSYKDDPEHFIAEKKKGVQHFLDMAQTQLFSADAGFQNALRRGLESTGASWDVIKKVLHEISTSQAHHAEGVAHRFLELGGLRYNPELMKFEAFEDPKGSWVGVVEAIKKAAADHGVPFEDMEKYAHKALEARRLALDVVPYNERLQQRVIQMIADGKRPSEARKVWDENRKVVHMTPEQIQAGMALFDKIPQLKEVADQWDNTRKNVIKIAVDTGLYSKEKAEALLDTLAYVPFLRVEQLENRAGPKEFSRGLLDAAEDKKFKGSYQEVNNIFDNMERWTSYMIRKGVNNKSAQNLTNAAMKYMPDEVRQVDRVARGMRENTFSIWENGEKQLYEFQDPMFVHAFTGMEAIAIPALQGAAKYTNMLRQNIVLNPLFSIGQLSQDSFGAMLTAGLKHPFAIPLEVMKEFAKTMRGTSASHEELKNVAAVGLRDYSAATSRYDAEITAGLKEATNWQKFKKPFEKLSMASDNAVRQAIYNRTLLETGGKRMADGRIVGGDKATAIEKAFEIINFRRGGANEMVTVLRRTVPFFGAYLQSMNVAAKVLAGRGISPTERAEAYRVLGSNLAKVMALGFLYNTVISEDDGYKKLDPTVRDRHLVMPGTDGAVMIPLRSDIFTLISKIIPEHLYQMTLATETEDATKAKKAIGAAVGNALLSPTVMPQAIKPLFEVGINHNMFTGQPIVGQGQEHLDTNLQYGPNTSQLAKAIGATGLIAPLNVDYLLKSYFGYTGGMALLATDGLIAQMTGETLPDKTLRDSIATIPGMSAFTSKEFGTKDMNDFYELKDLTTRAVASLNKMKEIATPEEIQAYREKNQALIAANKQVTRISENLSKLKKQERKIMESDMDSTEKQMKLYELKVREHTMVKNIDALRKQAGL